MVGVVEEDLVVVGGVWVDDCGEDILWCCWRLCGRPGRTVGGLYSVTHQLLKLRAYTKGTLLCCSCSIVD